MDALELKIRKENSRSEKEKELVVRSDGQMLVAHLKVDEVHQKLRPANFVTAYEVKIQ